MRRAFSIAELVIVVCIIGILAAMVLPSFQNNAMEAKIAAAKDNLRILRSVVELYAANHKDVSPGYPDNEFSAAPTEEAFIQQTTIDETYLRDIPSNPFNNLNTIDVLADDEDFPVQASGDYGWLYKPLVRKIRIDWPGADDKQIRYYDY